MEEALKKSGISNFTNVKNFNSEKFAQSIKNLGTTAKELFGAETDQILKLADEIGSVKITGLESDQVLRQFRNIKGDTRSNTSLVRKLEALSVNFLLFFAQENELPQLDLNHQYHLLIFLI